jgi:hypothetical protein
MAPEMHFLASFISAKIARKRFFSGMDTKVFLEVVVLCGPIVTQGASERFFAGVGANVTTEVTG